MRITTLEHGDKFLNIISNQINIVNLNENGEYYLGNPIGKGESCSEKEMISFLNKNSRYRKVD